MQLNRLPFSLITSEGSSRSRSGALGLEPRFDVVRDLTGEQDPAHALAVAAHAIGRRFEGLGPRPEPQLSRSPPGPPQSLSLPESPLRRSRPAPPVRRSRPRPALRRSRPSPPSRRSLPRPPIRRSLPANPERRSLPEVPRTVSAPEEPVLTAAVTEAARTPPASRPSSPSTRRMCGRRVLMHPAGRRSSSPR